jgi:hypothetical protein
MITRTLFRDDFARVDANNLGANWVALGSQNNLQIVGGVVEQLTINVDSGNLVNQSFGNNQWAQLVIPATIATNSPFVAIWLRWTDSSNAYLFVVDLGFNTTIQKKVGGVLTTIATGAVNPWVAGDQLTATIFGSSLRMYRNGALILSAIDTSLQTGSSVGLGISHA